MSAAHLGEADVFLDICRAIEELPPSQGAPDAKSLLLEGLARMHTDGRAVATAILQRAATAVAQLPEQDVLRWGWIAPMASNATSGKELGDLLLGQRPELEPLGETVLPQGHDRIGRLLSCSQSDDDGGGPGDGQLMDKRG